MPLAFPRGQALSAAIVIGLGFAFGGGGSGAGFANLVVQLGSLTVLAFHPRAFLEFFRSAPRAVTILVGLTMLLPLLQSIPLPPSVWQQLPGRDLASQSFRLIGRSDAWLPFSLEAHRTLIAFFSLVPPFAILMLGWRLSRDQARSLVLLVLGAALCMVLLGAQQMALGNRYLMLFAEGVGSSDLQGTFANRNSAGLFLVIALCLLVGVFPMRRPTSRWILAGSASALLLSIGLVLTQSRSSMVLALVPAGLAMLRLWQARMASGMRSRAVLAIVFVGGALILGAGAMLLSQNHRVQKSMSRFDSVLDDRRPKIWEDTFPAIERFWPVGSGIGTFDEVFQVDESLENLAPTRAARAHNDYLETALESGVAGIGLLIGWCIVLAWAGIHAIRAGGTAQAAVASLVVIAFQSVSDYPLRNQSLLCLAGLMLALLVGALRRRQSGDAASATAVSRK